jgi:hypothetical protein
MGAAAGGGSGCEDCEGIGNPLAKRFFAGFIAGLTPDSLETEITRAEDLRTSCNSTVVR